MYTLTPYARQRAKRAAGAIVCWSYCYLRLVWCVEQVALDHKSLAATRSALLARIL